jgi:hypothetical protein
MLPIQQGSKGQGPTARLTIQPDAEIVQSYLGGQTGLEAGQFIGPLSVQTKGMMQLITHRLYNLPQASHPATQPFRPGLAVVPLRRTDYPGPIVVVTMLMPCFPLKSLVHYVVARGWATHCRHPGVRAMPEGQEILGQCLVFGTGWGKAEASDDSLGVDREQHMEPFIPAQTVAPANIRLTCQANQYPSGWHLGWESQCYPELGREFPEPGAKPPENERKRRWPHNAAASGG